MVYLGRDEQSHQKEVGAPPPYTHPHTASVPKQKPSQEALDAVISCVLHSSRKPEVRHWSVCVCVSECVCCRRCY